MITDALKYGDIDMLMSPWSPPAYMKTNGEINHGGKLKEEYFELWSQFYVKFIEAYKKRRTHWLYHGTEWAKGGTDLNVINLSHNYDISVDWYLDLSPETWKIEKTKHTQTVREEDLWQLKKSKKRRVRLWLQLRQRWIGWAGRPAQRQSNRGFPDDGVYLLWPPGLIMKEL